MSDQEENCSETTVVNEETAEPLSVAELAELRACGADGALPLARVRASLGAGVADTVVGAAAEVVGTLARATAARRVLGAQGFCAAIAHVLTAAPGTASVTTLGWAARAAANLAYEDAANRDRLLAAGAVPPLVAFLKNLHESSSSASHYAPPLQLRFAVAAVGNASAQHAGVSAACGEAGAVKVLAGVLQSAASVEQEDDDEDIENKDALCGAAAQALENVCAGHKANSARLLKAGGAALVVALLRARRGSTAAEHAQGPCAARHAGLALLDALALTAQDRGDLVNSAAWRAALAEAGVLPALLDLAVDPPFVPIQKHFKQQEQGQDDDEEEEEEEEQGLQENECLQESAAHMLAALVGDVACATRFGPCVARALAFAGDGEAASPQVAGARRLAVRAAQHSVSRAVAQACAVPDIAESVLAHHADALCALLAPTVDAAVRANALGAWALVAADPVRGSTVATMQGGAIVTSALDALGSASDTDAVALRALRLAHNLLVAPVPRACLLAAGAAPRLVHVLDAVANPVILFDAVRCLGAAVSDPADPAALAALEHGGAFRALALLARAEKGVPEPEKKEGEQAKEQQQQEEEEKKDTRDLRVAYEATRVLMRAMRCKDDEHFGMEVLEGERGCVEAFARIAAAPWAVLHRELADTLTALLTHEGTRQALAHAAATERAAWDAIVTAADTVEALQPLAPKLRGLLA